jgi:hypothetical protein
MVARALAIVHTCIYDAWAAYDKRALGTQFGSSLRQHPSKHKRANRNNTDGETRIWRHSTFAATRARVRIATLP